MINNKGLFVIGATLLLSACAAQGTGERATGTGNIASVEIKDGKIVAKNDKGRAIKTNAKEVLAFVGDTVNFNYDSSDVKGEFSERVGFQAAILNTFGKEKYTIEGHADERGTSEYNLALGERRASSTRRGIASEGGDTGKIEIISYGEERPATLGGGEDAWSQNRRTVTILSK